MNQIEEILVVKRSGDVVDFDSVRIHNAISAALKEVARNTKKLKYKKWLIQSKKKSFLDL